MQKLEIFFGNFTPVEMRLTRM
ncbi:unnamed protein product, partial [Allacma fusca]